MHRNVNHPDVSLPPSIDPSPHKTSNPSLSELFTTLATLSFFSHDTSYKREVQNKEYALYNIFPSRATLSAILAFLSLSLSLSRPLFLEVLQTT